MLKPRPLYCPNVVLLDSGTESFFPIEEAKSIIEKISIETKLIVVYINNDIENSDESQIVVKSFDYTIYQEKRQNHDSFTSKLLNIGAKHVYYIKTDIKMYRNAFVHFYDILAANYPMVCISNLLATQIQAAAIVIPNFCSENYKEELFNQILTPTKLFSTNEFLMQTQNFLNKPEL